MSLNYNLKLIKNFEELCYYSSSKKNEKKGISYLRPTTNTLIWETIFVNINKINDNTIKEWWFRLQFMRYATNISITENLILKGRKYQFCPLDITMADLKAHIGLSTNADVMSRKDWLAKQARILSDRISEKLTDVLPVDKENEEIWLKDRIKMITAWEKEIRAKDKIKLLNQNKKEIAVV